MKYPFLILCIPLILGIIVSYFFSISLILLYIILFILLIYLFYTIRNKKDSMILLILVFFIIGNILIINKSDKILLKNIGNTYILQGEIIDILVEEEEYAKYILDINKMDNKRISERMIINIYSNNSISIGSSIGFRGELKIPKRNTNPKLFNYRLSLKGKDIFTQSDIKRSDIIYINSENISFKYKIKEKFKEYIVTSLDSNLKTDNRDIMKSILIGSQDYLDEEKIQPYKDMGLMHIMAVSGLHIGIICGFIIFLLSGIGINRNISIFISLMTIWIYAFLIGFPPSVLRANIMFSLLYISEIIYEPNERLNTVSLAIFILLFKNPYYLFNIGFQLSFICTFVLIIIQPRLSNILKRRFYILDKLSPTISIQIGLLPIQAYYFNSISLFSPLANFFIIPLLSLALVLLILVLFIIPIRPISTIIYSLIDFILDIHRYILNIFSSIKFNKIKIYSPNFLIILIYYLFLFLIFKIIDIKKLSKDMIRVLSLYMVFIFILNCLAIIDNNKLELHIIDVGQGDAILIRNRDKNILVDTGGTVFGNFNIGKNITLPYLEKLGIKTIDSLFITHFDADHYQGIFALFGNIEIKQIYASYIPEDIEFLDSIKKYNIDFNLIYKDMYMKINKDMDIKVIWPEKDIEDRVLDSNDKSLVLLLSVYDKKILLTGDMEKYTEDNLMINLKKSDRIDFLKIPHHGSNTSSSKDFLDRIRPRYGLISVGRNNRYNHPDKEILDRYRDNDIILYRTDDMGRILVQIERDGYEIKTFMENRDVVSIDISKFILENLYIIILFLVYLMILYILVLNYYLEEWIFFVL